ncbi:hypothetical protein EIN_148440 [Entamoeba invadens IP1]|uniref:t-SNARE coiled-coil homology domain-containing protein n=1 Tax=Entamoeba invadens IP1 TaxID=370355 RepID=L7FM56_ENTIV|nr:hypothetical protein EIN_148440 [Entamoeba invadens IP1]ELP85532.1 hypothetical protein EIN_148440 [Entamoeba invadens IP1]|eukprot:XP_004184878.1 hypothetical protein EIN_148440 [Entamoeba invadens IP1]
MAEMEFDANEEFVRKDTKDMLVKDENDTANTLNITALNGYKMATIENQNVKKQTEDVEQIKKTTEQVGQSVQNASDTAKHIRQMRCESRKWTIIGIAVGIVITLIIIIIIVIVLIVVFKK